METSVGTFHIDWQLVVNEYLLKTPVFGSASGATLDEKLAAAQQRVEDAERRRVHVHVQSMPTTTSTLHKRLAAIRGSTTLRRAILAVRVSASSSVRDVRFPKLGASELLLDFFERVFESSKAMISQTNLAMLIDTNKQMGIEVDRLARQLEVSRRQNASQARRIDLLKYKEKSAKQDTRAAQRLAWKAKERQKLKMASMTGPDEWGPDRRQLVRDLHAVTGVTYEKMPEALAISAHIWLPSLSADRAAQTVPSVTTTRRWSDELSESDVLGLKSSLCGRRLHLIVDGSKRRGQEYISKLAT